MNTLNDAEIAIIGGGIAGVALAYYLARGGATDIVVVDRDQLGSGSTAYSFAGIRQQFSTPLEIELSKRGLRFWKTCEEQFDSPCPFHQMGYLFVTGNRERLALLAAAADLQRSLGAGPAHMLGPDGIEELAPWIRGDGLAGGCWTPEDGRVTATDGVTALAKGARALGVRLRQYWPVAEVTRAPGGFAVSGPKGTIRAKRVVVAAGLWAPALLRPLGIEIDVSAMTLHYALTGEALTGRTVPLTVDFDTGFCIEREGPGLALTVLLEKLPDGYGFDDMFEDLVAAATTRAPSLLDLPITHRMSADADMVSDGHPNAGMVDEDLWVLAGFAGHGVMHGPPLAELLALQMLGTPDPELDIAILDPRRMMDRAGGEWMVAAKKGRG